MPKFPITFQAVVSKFIFARVAPSLLAYSELFSTLETMNILMA
jgi:hypothetical protein